MSPRTALSSEEKHRRRLARYPEALALVDEGKARPRVVEAVGYLRQGLNGVEIAEAMGLSRSLVGDLLLDPTEERTKARKARTDGICVDCGGRTVGDGRRRPPKRCLTCAIEDQKANAKWTAANCIAAIQRWTEEHGEVPKASDWHNGIRRVHPDYVAGGWPAYNTVSHHFGTFNAGVRAAGLKPFREIGGHPRVPSTPEELAETAALVERHGLDEAAQRLGLGVEGVRRRLKKHNDQWIGDNRMGAPLTAQDVLSREVEKCDLRLDRIREETKALEDQRKDLVAAKAALNGGAAKS